MITSIQPSLTCHVKEKVLGDTSAHFVKASVFAELPYATLAHVLQITQLTLGVSFDTKQNEQQLMQIIIESNPALENTV